MSAIAWVKGGAGREAQCNPRRGSDFYRENLAASIQAALWVDTVRPDRTAVNGVHGQLRRFECVGSPAIGAAAFGLFAFRVSHVEKQLVCLSIS
jgi:hypothetical protein